MIRTQLMLASAAAFAFALMLGPLDDPRAYHWHLEDGYAVLDRQPNGDCVYLGEQGCSIHERAPSICRRFDCRVLVLLTPQDVQQRRVQENPQMAAVYEAGRQRLHTLSTAAAGSTK